MLYNLRWLQSPFLRKLVERVGGNKTLVHARVKPCGVRTAQIRHDRAKGCRVLRNVTGPTVKCGQDFEWQTLCQWVDGNYHVGASSRVTRGSSEALLKGIEADELEQ